MDDGCGVADKHGNLLGLTKLVNLKNYSMREELIGH